MPEWARAVRQRALRNAFHQILQQHGVGVQQILLDLDMREPAFVPRTARGGSDHILALASSTRSRWDNLGSVRGGCRSTRHAGMERRAEALFFTSLTEAAV
jgi:hypothetical protein